jgi:hypothetical protein
MKTPRRGGPLRPPVLTELFLGTKCSGFAPYPVLAFTEHATPLGTLLCIRCIRLPQVFELLITTAFLRHVEFIETSNALDAYLERSHSVDLQRIRIS